MLIKDRLKIGEHIKLGIQGGAFIVCETVDNNTYKKIDNYIQRIFRYRTSRVEEINRSLKRYKDKECFKKSIRMSMGQNKISEDEAREKLFNKIERLNKEKERLLLRIDYFKPLSERLLLEQYQSITEKAKILIIEGDETGMYFGTLGG